MMRARWDSFFSRAAAISFLKFNFLQMCDESEPSIGGRPISEMKVVELKEELGKRGLSKIGNKNALHERLKEYLLTEINAKCESEVQSTAVESPQRDLTSPPNPLVAEYLARQQTALREARKDAEAVRRASSGEDASPIREKSLTAMRRSRRSGRSTTTTVIEKPVESVVTSETEQESVEAQSQMNDVEETENDSSAPTELLKREADVGVDSVSTAMMMKALEETERTETEYDETRLISDQQSIDLEERYPASTQEVSEEHEMQKQHENKDEEEDAVSDVASSVTGTSSRSRSEAADESNASWEQMPIDLEESSNQGMMETVDVAPLEKERIKGTATAQIKTKMAIAQEKKRRWKPSASAHSTNSVVTVSVVKHKEEEIEIDEQEDRPDTNVSAVSDFKEELSDTRDRMEELDYEEPMQSSIAEVAEEVKAAEEASERRKERVFERVERHAKHSGSSRISRRSPTPEKQQESHITVDGFVRERRVSPARYPVNQVIMIRQLTRPYTVKQLQQLLSTFGTIVEGGFWIDNIKSTCIAKYSTVEEAIVARGRLHNVVWPPCSPKTLKIDYSDDANLTKHLVADQLQSEEIAKGGAETTKSSSENSAPALRVSLSVDERRRQVLPTNQVESAKDLDKKEREGRTQGHRGRKRSASPIGHSNAKRARERRSPWKDERRRTTASPELKPIELEKRVKTADELFLKTKTQPAVYYLPLTDEQIIERMKRKAAEVELAKKVAQNGATKRKEKDEPAKEKTNTSKRIPITAPTSLSRHSLYRIPSTFLFSLKLLVRPSEYAAVNVCGASTGLMSKNGDDVVSKL
ncbi:Apoptotic chromatin condensation inducer in the nucleus [Dirofilaria immitis]